MVEYHYEPKHSYQPGGLVGGQARSVDKGEGLCTNEFGLIVAIAAVNEGFAHVTPPPLVVDRTNASSTRGG